MRIAVVMTTYNGERFIGEQLSSLLRQTRAADEVVIVDDCSYDQTYPILQAFINRHGLERYGWKLYRNDRQLGFKANFRRAFSLASGDRIAPCDQDDVWHPEKLRRMSALFDEHPDMRSLGCAFNRIDANGRVLGKCENLLPFHVERGTLVNFPAFAGAPHLILAANRLLGCTMMVDRRTLDAYLRHTRGEIAHDWEINLVAVIEGGLYFIDQPLIDYRLHESNAIGLRAEARRGLRVDVEGRRVVHAGFEGALRFARDYLASAGKAPLSERYDRYARTRGQLLDKRSSFALLRLWTRYFDIYSKLLTPRQRVGDVMTLIPAFRAHSNGNGGTHSAHNMHNTGYTHNAHETGSVYNTYSTYVDNTHSTCNTEDAHHEP